MCIIYDTKVLKTHAKSTDTGNLHGAWYNSGKNRSAIDFFQNI